MSKVSKILAQLRIDPTIHKKLKAIAEREGRSVNGQIDTIVRKYIEQYEAENGIMTVSDE